MAAAATLANRLTDAPHTFLQPTLPLYTDTAAYLKHILDPIAADVSTVQQQRLQEVRKKRKRGEALVDETDVLRLKQIHVDGFGPEQVWEQARRVIDAARHEAELGLVVAQDRQARNRANGKFGDEADLEGSDVDDEDLGEEGVDYEVEGVDDGEEIYESDSDEMDDALDQAEAGAEDDYAGEDLEMDGMDDFDEDEEADRDDPAEELVTDKFGLNDGFFSIDDFNKQSDFLEQQDIRGDDNGAASDEEDVDWDADPSALAAAGAGRSGAVDTTMDDADDDDEEDGPTLGDPDAPSEDEDDDEGLDAGEMDAMGGMGNTNDVMYKDFFAPPAQKKRKNKKGRPNPHNFPARTTTGNGPEAEGDDDVERTVAAVHRDLFEDESEPDDEEPQEKLDAGNPRSRRSAHERRKAALAEEIRKLEAANVAKREWTLSGEARGADRPVNSLLEEDLDFERAGKPVPVITAEVSESIEELIKRRILAYDFQDIIRRRPDDLATGKDARRGKLNYDLDDSKSKKGLAEEYEEEHLRRTDPNFVDVKDEKMRREEKEIEALWNQVRRDLDTLSSWHFRPKAPAPQLDIRVDAPTISLEDARPSAGSEVAGASQLAPQEVYRAGEAVSGKEEVAGKSGLPAAREEMSREEKLRRRRREKERIRKKGPDAGEVPKSKKAREKVEVVGSLKKGGVRVIGKNGRVEDLEGKEARSGSGETGGAGRYKL
ncbi:U3 snoRNP protein [Recurvomyces mirabilis]|uniref:U3 small nucleolar ribonucleoprotein protein MPP10 n=1 Tax=Recurvomyces mirabilis TaxID=574656 RepID=A0AAE1C055_9PEZI|nr:U3 snoRNP protein [Recurvomyces mirabilis]KAK5152159.1 U3 snoRNP protein [Recurvomyces mirabilis]